MKPKRSALFALISVLAPSVFATSHSASSGAGCVKGANDQSPATLPQTNTVPENNPTPQPLKLMESPATFDEAVGLWIDEGPGHTAPVSKLPRVHNGRNAVMRLIRAAQTGSLKEMPVASVLRALEAMQVRDQASERYGCFRWYWEEAKPVDTNAAFFIGMGLLVLDQARGADLDEESRQRLQQMFPPLERWFDREVKSRTFYYPNKYLGDLVCAWLLREYSRSSVEELRAATLEATAYWQEQSWGWGEHMSDVYAKVMLNQLSVVLLYTEHLPPDVRAAFQDLAQRLLVINDAFAGGPRVPLIRSYAFQDSPHENSFRDSIYDWKGQDSVPPASYAEGGLGHFFWERGWHDVFGAKAVGTRDYAFSCFGGNTAVARVEADIRFGSLSTFPLMPSADHKTWGLSWQSFPVAFWRQQGDWGFLRWRAVEQGQERCHPAVDKARSYLDNALNQSSSPPITGQTFALQRGDSILVMRRMPVIVDSWDSVGDGLTLIEPHFTAQSVEETASGWRLRLNYPERAVTVDCLRLPETASPVWTSGENGVASWRTELVGDSLRGARGFLALWLFHFGAGAGAGKVQLLPQSDALVPVPRSGSEQAGIVQWRDADGEHRVAFDPLSATPLKWVR